MILDHERLDVYRLALDFLVFANQVLEPLPRGRAHLCDQLTRASTSIVLNLAEGAGKHSKADKRCYYLTARGSATERQRFWTCFCAWDYLTRPATGRASRRWSGWSLC